MNSIITLWPELFFLSLRFAVVFEGIKLLRYSEKQTHIQRGGVSVFGEKKYEQSLPCKISGKSDFSF